MNKLKVYEEMDQNLEIYEKKKRRGEKRISKQEVY